MDDDLINYIYVNMDERCVTTTNELNQYVAKCKYGIWRSINAYDFKTCIIAYGTKSYDFSTIEAILIRLGKLEFRGMMTY